MGLVWNSAIPVISIFIAFVPLFNILNSNKLNYNTVFNLTFLTFLIYHFCTVWWLYKSSIPGSIAIIMLNSIFMALVAMSGYSFSSQFGKPAGILAFISFWLSFEFIHFHWQLSWPFMNLGNWLGQMPIIIQWYEYTGILGGTLWILLVNACIYLMFQHFLNLNYRMVLIHFSVLTFLIILPLWISYELFNNYIESGNKIKVRIIQPNIDPYKEKYVSNLFDNQIENQLNLAISDSVGIDCFVFPESSFPIYIDEKNTNSQKQLSKISETLLKSGKSVIGGLYSYTLNNNDTLFYNTAFRLNPGLNFYHKSKLVPGVERMPFENYFHFLRKMNVSFGGITNSLQPDKERKIFSLVKKNCSIAPVICYESVYGEFVSGFIRKGATCIAVITNDGWWGNTPGYHQHLIHSQIRAIENRRSVVRSANTGISCIISPRGEILIQSEPLKANALNGSLSQENKITFYTLHGDFIGRISLISTFILSVIQGLKLYRKKPEI
ncbi:MAG: apolipoprotein N-acyltransferase [Bacteroidales bacterium]